MIIQDPKTKEFKKHKPHELPDGCVVTAFDLLGTTDTFIVRQVKLQSKLVSNWYSHYNNSVFRLHDIVTDKGERTHHLRYMATDEEGGTYLYVTSPTRDSDKTFISDDYYECKYIGKNICGQTWEDEPCEVWECIK